MEHPKISIVTVVYNGAGSIEATIRSVLDLTWPNVEYIIIDGGSKDGTQDIISKYSDKIAYWCSEKDKGIFDAMNKGIERATGEWINFMNVGDRFYAPDVLDIFGGDLGSTDVVFGEAIVEYNGFESIYQRYPLQHIWRQMPFCHQASFARTQLMKKLKFDLSYRLSADYDFLYRSYLAKNTFTYVDRVICMFNYTEGASKENKLASLTERKRSSLQHQSTFVHRLYFFLFLIYVRLNILGKSLLGERLTRLITKILKQK